MKKAISLGVLLFGLLFVLSGAASAQTFDAFGGYSFDHLSQTDTGVKSTSNLNGGEGTVGFYPLGIFGVVGDFADYHFSNFNTAGVSTPVGGNVVTYLFGPKVRFPVGPIPIKPFAQVLFGGAHLGNVTSNSTAVCGGVAPCTVNPSSNSFALTAEGGVDVKMARHFALRGQAGYLMTRFQTGTADQRITQNNVRVSVGIVIE